MVCSSTLPRCSTTSPTVGRSTHEARDGARRHRLRAVAVSDERAVDSLARALGHPRPEIMGGAGGLVTMASELDADVVLSAIVGGAGLLPTMAAIETGKAVAIANKEPLVMAGSLMTAASRRHKAPLLPVDSE